ncbi:glycosyltransferase, partial [Vibrio splendidus]
FITVSYNNFKSTKSYVESFLSLYGLDDVSLLVVDNSSVEDLELKCYIEGKPDLISYLRQNENKGYMAACNFGYEKIKNDLDKNSVIIYSNNDLIFNTKEMCIKIREVFLSDKNIGVLSPRVNDTNCDIELNPFLIDRPKKSSLNKLRLLFSNYYLCKLFHFFKKNKNKKNIVLNSSDIYATHGCIFILNNEVLSEKPDDEYFLYGEEVTIAEICREKKLLTVFVDDISISHVSHATTGNEFTKFQFSCKKNAIKHIVSKYSW